MKTYHFELVLDAILDDAQEEGLYELLYGRVSSALVNGKPLLYAHLDAGSIEEAIREAVRATRELGIGVRRIEIDPGQLIDEAA